MQNVYVQCTCNCIFGGHNSTTKTHPESTALKASQQHIIDEIRSGNERCLEELYLANRDEFIVWACRDFKVSEEVAKDIFQEAILDFHQNIVSGQLKEFTAKPKSYLFQIGKFKLINFINRERKFTYKDNLELIKGKELDDYVNKERKAEVEETVSRAVEKLPDDCRKVLELYYSKGYDMDSIAREMGYKNADTAKSKKSLCMKKLLAELNKLATMLIF